MWHGCINWVCWAFRLAYMLLAMQIEFYDLSLKDVNQW